MNQTLRLIGVDIDESPRLQEIHRMLIPDDRRFRQELKWMRDNGSVYIDPATIPGISRLGDEAPKLLFGLCARTEFPMPVSIVGTRRPDWYGKTMGYFLGKEIAGAGCSVVSGGALGIDTLAHRGCLDAGKATIVVFAGGLAMPHPPSNKALFKKIAKTGCIISELPPMVPAKRFSFTQRNRIISLLGTATIVVQAGPLSGALVTGRWGLKIGSPVFALPADCIFNNGKGTNTLIHEGAIPMIDQNTLKTGLGIQINTWPHASRRPIHSEPVINQNVKQSAKAKGASGPGQTDEQPLHGEEADIYTLISKGTNDVDTLCIKTQMPTAQVLSVLSSLEIKGYIKRAGGGRFIPIKDPDLFS